LIFIIVECLLQRELLNGIDAGILRWQLDIVVNISNISRHEPERNGKLKGNAVINEIAVKCRRNIKPAVVGETCVFPGIIRPPVIVDQFDGIVATVHFAVDGAKLGCSANGHQTGNKVAEAP